MKVETVEIETSAAGRGEDFHGLDECTCWGRFSRISTRYGQRRDEEASFQHGAECGYRMK